MINPTETGVGNKHFKFKKGVCDQRGVCRYCDAPPYFKIKDKSQTLLYRHLIINWTEDNKI